MLWQWLAQGLISFNFWNDICCGDFACEKETLVAHLMGIASDMVQWKVSFTSMTQDWEVDILEQFFRLLYSINLSPKIHFRFAFSIRISHNWRIISWKRIWRNEAPPKAAFFAWAAFCRKTLTTNNLWKHREIVVFLCVCAQSDEKMDGLLLHYGAARAQWNDVFRRIELA